MRKRRRSPDASPGAEHSLDKVIRFFIARRFQQLAPDFVKPVRHDPAQLETVVGEVLFLDRLRNGVGQPAAARKPRSTTSPAALCS